MMIPFLRADFLLIQTYEYLTGIPLQCSITIYCGLQNPKASQKKLLSWKELTLSKFALHMLPGDISFCDRLNLNY
jgi:medium-chain acyl-[acyl-carrier-protein] hydrolase